MIYLFDVKEHEEYGMLGLRLRGKPHFDPVTGMGAAHDILEHFPNDEGDMEAEMQALGASLLVRNDAYFNMRGNKHSAVDNLASDFPFTFDQHMEGRTMLRDPGRYHLHGAIADQLAELGPAIRKAFADERDGEALPEWVATGEAERRLLGWINKGYRRAIKRYKGVNHWLPAMFQRLEQELDSALKHAEEGQVVRAAVNFKTGAIGAVVDYED
jgi:hypothetical protein